MLTIRDRWCRDSLGTAVTGEWMSDIIGVIDCIKIIETRIKKFCRTRASQHYDHDVLLPKTSSLFGVVVTVEEVVVVSEAMDVCPKCMWVD